MFAKPMFRMALLLAGIIGLSGLGIFWLQPSFFSPHQQMEWQFFDLPDAGNDSVAGTEIFTAPLPLAPERPERTEKIEHSAPFAAQAPFGEWHDPRYQDGCEEAAALMAVKAARGESLDRIEVRDAIADLSLYQLEKYGTYKDTSAADTLNRIIEGYFGYSGRVEYGIDKNDIIEALYQNNLVLAPTDGRRLNNPNYSQPGPARHMILIKGYDPASDRFITNDPGTRQGAGQTYEAEILLGAIRDYPTGDHEPDPEDFQTAIIIIPLYID